GDELTAALDDELWFDGEFRQLLAIGQATGELDSLLERIGRRYARQAERLIDRLAALLEPSVILTLAVLVGLVVMAAILPLLRLQEVL
ncbi:MAG: type II secretion system F family protein, partial [Planctomycetes bacterium]|nr:type II secretion system F family protein [Planctomycetota bacterium]